MKRDIFQMCIKKNPGYFTFETEIKYFKHDAKRKRKKTKKNHRQGGHRKHCKRGTLEGEPKSFRLLIEKDRSNPDLT